MALKNQALTICYVAWNTSSNAGQTGDASNHTLKIVQDGSEANPTNSPSEVDATNLPGVYKLALTSGDMNYNCVVLGGKSSTSNVSIIPLVIVTERGVLPTVAPATSGGFPTVGTSTGQINPDGSGNVTVGGYKSGQDPATLVWAASTRTLSAFGFSVTVGTNSDKTGYSLTTAPPTAAAIATAVWTDTTAGDFTTTSSPGKILVAQLGGAFTSTSSSVYSTASLANAPTGESAPTAAAIATAVWTDLLSSSDFSTASSVGALVKANTAQTGDAYARIGATGSGLTSLAPASTALSTVNWTSTLATNLGTLYTASAAIVGSGTVTSATSASSFTVSLGGATMPSSGNAFVGLFLRFTSGANGSPVTQTQAITSATTSGTTAVLTFTTGFTSTPSNGDTFDLI